LERRCISLSGTTTTGPPALMMPSVAVMEERRRRAGLPVGNKGACDSGDSMSGGAIWDSALIGSQLRQTEKRSV
jgi:hypothetical protein